MAVAGDPRGPEPSPRLLCIMQDLEIKGRARIQKYGFRIHHYYPETREFGFYEDWKIDHAGPYSDDLADDLDGAIRGGYVREFEDAYNGTGLKRYSITGEGRVSYDRIKRNETVRKIRRFLEQMEGQSLMAILRQINREYLVHAGSSQIRKA